MTTAPAVWRHSERAAVQITNPHKPDTNNTARADLLFLLSLLFIGSFIAPVAATANWGCNVIAPAIAIACLGIAGWHFKSGRGYMGWGVSGVALMVISGQKMGAQSYARY